MTFEEEEEFLIELKAFIWRRAASMHGGGVSVEQMGIEYGEDFMEYFLNKHSDTFTIYNRDILRNDMMSSYVPS